MSRQSVMSSREQHSEARAPAASGGSGTPFMAAAVRRIAPGRGRSRRADSASAEGGFAFDLGGQCAERGRDVAGQLNLRPIVAVDVRGDGIDVDELTRRVPCSRGPVRIRPGCSRRRRPRRPRPGACRRAGCGTGRLGRRSSRRVLAARPRPPGKVQTTGSFVLARRARTASAARGWLASRPSNRTGCFAPSIRAAAACDRLGVRRTEPAPVQPG